MNDGLIKRKLKKLERRADFVGGTVGRGESEKKRLDPADASTPPHTLHTALPHSVSPGH